jgi:hypothetical protein
MAHLLTRYRWADTAGIPPAIAALAKCAHAGFRQTENFGCRMQAIVAPENLEKSERIWLILAS